MKPWRTDGAAFRLWVAAAIAVWSGAVVVEGPRQVRADPRAPLIGRTRVVRSACSGALLTLVTLALYASRLGHGAPYARAAAMVVIVVGIHLLRLRQKYSVNANLFRQFKIALKWARIFF